MVNGYNCDYSLKFPLSFNYNNYQKNLVDSTTINFFGR